LNNPTPTILEEHKHPTHSSVILPLPIRRIR